MSRINNTTKTKNVEWLFGGNPRAIENQEKQGQDELLSSSQLPAKINSHSRGNIKEIYKKMGIRILNVSKGGEMFFDVILPEGWKIEATDHPMWSNLLDDKGRERASIFYKATFYDRDAFININSRFSVKSEPEDFYKSRMTYKERDAGNWAGIVRDCGEIIWQTDWQKEDFDKYDLAKEASDWLDKNYPKWQDVTSYWD